MRFRLVAALAAALLLGAWAGPRVPLSTGAAASNLAVKGSAGVLWGFSVTSGATAGYVLVFDATSAPADGTVTPVKCYSLGATQTLGVSWLPGPPMQFLNGLVIVFSTTGCFTKTASATAYISAEYE